VWVFCLRRSRESGFFVFVFLRWHPRFRFGLLALPLCGAAVTFFAAAKKVTKESRFKPPVPASIAPRPAALEPSHSDVRTL
jgi:hypothetical protein